MCRSLVAKVAQSEQLQAVAAPQVLILFEDWMEELEVEILNSVKAHGRADPMILVDELGLSRSGAEFLVAKMTAEGKI